MAYSAVPTKSVGETWSAAENNTYIRDNFAAGVPDIFTTKGDIAVASAADVAGRLGIGTNGYVLTAASGETLGMIWALDPVKDLVTTKGDILAASAADTLARVGVGSDHDILESLAAGSAGVAWVTTNLYFARYTRDTTQAISNDTVTIIEYVTSVYDPNTDVTTAPWKYTVPVSGYYLVTASAILESNAGWEVGEVARIMVYVDGVISTILAATYMNAAGTYNVACSGAAVIYAAAASYIDIRIYQNSDGAINILSASTANHVAIARLI